MSVVHTSLFCHAPIVVPAVGGVRGEACARTTAAMAALADAVVAHEPDVVVVVSPHTPRLPGAVAVLADGVGVDLADFRANVAFALPGLEDREGLRAAAAREGLALEGIRVRRLDHGAGVPLCFLYDAGWRGPTVVVGLPRGDDDELQGAAALGQAIARWSHGLRVALVCSGDGSHRLTPDAPAGFDPEGRRFDEVMLAHLQRGDDDGVIGIDPALRERAAEDIVASVVVGAHAAGHARQRRVLSYEGPFGVGYTVAVLDDPGAVDDHLPRPPPALLTIARDALVAARAGLPPPPLPDLVVDGWGVMVSWHRRDDGALRGCLGHVPSRDPIVATVREMGVAAATRDPRFAPVDADEIDGLQATITLVAHPEPIAALPADHDVTQWGIMVQLGHRQGLLLPDLEGVDTADAQLRITLEKARIAPDEPYTLQRFRARSITEGRP